jgi:hypothetical protein
MLGDRIGPMFPAKIRRKRVNQKRAYSNGQWHLDEVFVKINGGTHYLWRAVDHEGEVLESFDNAPLSQGSVQIPVENHETPWSRTCLRRRQATYLRRGDEEDRQR